MLSLQEVEFWARTAARENELLKALKDAHETHRMLLEKTALANIQMAVNLLEANRLKADTQRKIVRSGVLGGSEWGSCIDWHMRLRSGMLPPICVHHAVSSRRRLACSFVTHPHNIPPSFAQHPHPNETPRQREHIERLVLTKAMVDVPAAKHDEFSKAMLGIPVVGDHTNPRAAALNRDFQAMLQSAIAEAEQALGSAASDTSSAATEGTPTPPRQAEARTAAREQTASPPATSKPPRGGRR